ncbi:hypothetical protein J6S46_03150 [Candidatus Saccharibacteria bacterium]|nr:hypothetical protein [Candidatus Saccharibacteria bacterium]
MYTKEIDELRKQIRSGEFAKELAVREEDDELARYAIRGLMVMTTMKLPDETVCEIMSAVVWNVCLNFGKMMILLEGFVDPELFKGRETLCKELFPKRCISIVREEGVPDDLKKLSDADVAFMIPCVIAADSIDKDFFAEFICKIYRSGILPKTLILQAMFSSCYTRQEYEKMRYADKVITLTELFGKVFLTTGPQEDEEETEADEEADEEADGDKA